MLPRFALGARFGLAAGQGAGPFLVCLCLGELAETFVGAGALDIGFDVAGIEQNGLSVIGHGFRKIVRVFISLPPQDIETGIIGLQLNAMGEVAHGLHI